MQLSPAALAAVLHPACSLANPSPEQLAQFSKGAHTYLALSEEAPVVASNRCALQLPSRFPAASLPLHS
jgi:hypothetical protein